MIENIKPVDALCVEDLMNFAVWQFTNREGQDETYVRPVKRIPVANLSGRVVGSKVVLSSGRSAWALIGNVILDNERLAEHFLTISIERNGKWFSLARYHDFDFDERGPEALSSFLGIPVDSIFPISYDIRNFVSANAACLHGKIFLAPREKLTRAELIAMAVP